VNRERRSEDRPTEDPPDWFDAGGAQGATTSTTDGHDGNDGHDDARAGEWFDDPDHRPVETVPKSTDEPSEEPASPVANGATDGEANATDVPGVTDEEGTGVDTPAGPAGTTVGSPTSVDERSGRTGPASADVADDEGDGADENGAAPDEPGSEASEPGNDPDEGGPAGDGSEAVTARSRPDESGRTAADTDGSADARSTEDEVDGMDGEDTAATTSVVGRVLAWLRSLVGRSS